MSKFPLNGLLTNTLKILISIFPDIMLNTIIVEIVFIVTTRVAFI